MKLWRGQFFRRRLPGREGTDAEYAISNYLLVPASKAVALVELLQATNRDDPFTTIATEELEKMIKEVHDDE